MSTPCPSVEVKQLIADALHHGVSSFMEPSITHIGPINTIGCYLLRFMTGGAFYPVAGSITVYAGGAPFGVRADLERVHEHAYYLWIEGQIDETAAAEIIDFGARYWMDWAQEQGALWLKAEPSSHVWAAADAVPESLAVYETDPKVSAVVRHHLENAVASRQDPETLQQWEDAVNSAVDYLLEFPSSAQYLMDLGLAEPHEEV